MSALRYLAQTLMERALSNDNATDLKCTPLHSLHLAAGAKMGPFAGYEMPIQYPDGVLKEHLHTRQAAGLFDVSHMGQAFLSTREAQLGARDAHEKISAALETLAPGEFQKLKPGALRYSLLLNEEGGVMDDFIVTRQPAEDDAGKLFLVVNAACKEQDFQHIESSLAERASLIRLDDRALLALQGPLAASIIDGVFAGTAMQKFMTMTKHDWRGAEIFVSRCGYTGEDGFELSVPEGLAVEFAKMLLGHAQVKWVGLGARDSLRLEAGLCLYGHDLDPSTSPVEAGLTFAIGKRRRADGGFPGASRILPELSRGTSRVRIGIRPDGRAPAREGVEIRSTDGAPIGVVTSGGYGPTVQGPIAMGYVDSPHAAPGTEINLIVRGKPLAAKVVDVPFIAPNYFRG